MASISEVKIKKTPKYGGPHNRKNVRNIKDSHRRKNLNCPYKHIKIYNFPQNKRYILNVHWILLPIRFI